MKRDFELIRSLLLELEGEESIDLSSYSADQVNTYELRRYRSKWQNLAFGAVCALCALLVVGFVTEFWWSGWDWAYWVELEKEPQRSRVNYWFLSVGWLLLTGVFAGLGFKYRVPLPQSTQPRHSSKND